MIRIFVNVLFLVIIVSLDVLPQSGSAYTRFGIGDIQYTYSARRTGLGQLGTSVADADFISTLNPASLNALSKTRIEFGGNYNGIILSDNSVSGKFYSETEFSGFSIAFPVSQTYGIGLASGIVPYSGVSYQSIENYSSIDPNIGNYTIDYSGSGGLSRFYIGTSYRTPFGLSLGATLDYYFGNLNYNSEIKFEKTSIQSAEYQKVYKPRGLGTNIGLISPDLSKGLGLKDISDLRIGTSVNIISELDTDTLLWTRTTTLTDTLALGKVKMKVPYRISAGASFILKGKYLFLVDYAFQPWSEYKINNAFTGNLRDASKISTGFEYRPVKELGLSFWEQIILRAGLSFEQTPYEINGEGIDQLSFAFGLSFPLAPENTIDLGFEYAIRGTKDSGLIREDIIRLNFGISLGEIWFIRYEK